MECQSRPPLDWSRALSRFSAAEMNSMRSSVGNSTSAVISMRIDTPGSTAGFAPQGSSTWSADAACAEAFCRPHSDRSTARLLPVRVMQPDGETPVRRACHQRVKVALNDDTVEVRVGPRYVTRHLSAAPFDYSSISPSATSSELRWTSLNSRGVIPVSRLNRVLK